MFVRDILGIVWALTASVVLFAQAPVAPETTNKYPLTEREGPWLIHIGSFRGDQSLDYAHRLAEETRTKHRLLTFIYSMNEIDAVKDREELRQYQMKMIGTDKVPGSEEHQKFKTVRVIKEYSVFVGNYPDMEKAREEAERIKGFAPPTSIPSYGINLFNESNPNARTDSDAGSFGGMFKLKTTRSEDKKILNQAAGNPYRQAFVVRNPFLTKAAAVVSAQSQQPQATFDPSWRELNAKEKYSIFTCPKPWTIVVANFAPPTVVQSSLNVNVLQTGTTLSSAELGKALERAAETARQMAELLRDGGKGYDAYVFHTRQYSVVTVGAFDDRYDPKMEQAWTILKNFSESQTTGAFSLLLKLPRPMQVPGK